MAVKGTLAPTATLAVLGNLGLTQYATTLCTVTPQASDMINVKKAGAPAGIATLDGRLSVIMTGTFSPAVTRYTLLDAEGGFSSYGYQFRSVSIKYPTNQYFTPRITYDATHVYLDLDFTQ